MARNSISANSGSTDGAVANPIEPVAESGGTGNEPDNGAIDPASLGTGIDDVYERDGNGELVIGANGKPRRKRGRKSGGGNTGGSKSNGPRNSKAVDGLETLSQTLLVLHMGIANLTKFPDFQIDKKESDALAAATANVMEQFDIQPDPKITAIIGLLSTATTIYGPRVYLYNKHKEKLDKEKVKEDAAIMPFVPFGVVQQ
jgi:hypothetical protein